MKTWITQWLARKLFDLCLWLRAWSIAYESRRAHA